MIMVMAKNFWVNWSGTKRIVFLFLGGGGGGGGGGGEEDEKSKFLSP